MTHAMLKGSNVPLEAAAVRGGRFRNNHVDHDLALRREQGRV